MEKFEPIFSIHGFGITESIVVEWAVMLIIIIASLLLTRKLKRIPDKKQTALEYIVGMISNTVKDNMGEDGHAFIPYIGTLMIFLVLINLTGLVGFAPPTENLSVPMAFALLTFLIVQGFAIKKTGLGHYGKAFFKPYAFMLPLNLIERVMLPVSLSLRLFGNMVAGGIVVKLIYEALGNYAILIPVPVHAYFHLFDGVIQMVIFSMLTMINIKIIAEH